MFLNRSGHASPNRLGTFSVAKSFQIRSATNAHRALEIELARETDRFWTTLRLWVGGEAITVLRSVDRDHGAAWSASPVIQDLSKQETSTGTFLAGVGMAGTNHWSVVIETRPDAAAIEFDCACRVKQEPKWMGSTYSIRNAIAHQAAEHRPTLAVGDTVIVCETYRNQSARWIAETPGSLSIVPSLEPTGELPRTIRWKYRFFVV